MFPMLTTAAGTIPPAQVLVVGAGVAGLQAIATARRLGAVVQAYDVRPAAQEDIESLGARSVLLALSPGDAEDAGGYAKELGEAFYRRQQELLAQIAAGSRRDHGHRDDPGLTRAGADHGEGRRRDAAGFGHRRLRGRARRQLRAHPPGRDRTHQEPA